MTVTADPSRSVYTGAGTTGPFSIPFYFLADADIKVIRTRIADGIETTFVLNVDYTLTGAGNPSGGSLSTINSLSADYKLTIYRDPEATQPTDYPPYDDFPADSHERALDRVTMLVQRFKDLLSRAVRLSDGDVSGASTVLPAPVPNGVIGFNATGNGLAVIVSLGGAATTAFTLSLLDDADGDDFWATLIDGMTDPDGTIQALFDAITALGAAPAVGDKLIISDVSETPDEVRSITVQELFDAANNLTAESAPNHTDDQAVIYDASAGATKKVALSLIGPPVGSVQAYIGTTAPTGWLLLYGGTIGNASSGGTARANADTEDLYTLLWNSMADAQAPVSSGRGASAAADFAANKTITLPDLRGRVIAGYDSMGGSSANRLTDQSGGLDGDVQGDTGGAETHTLTSTQMPAHTHSITLKGASSVSGPGVESSDQGTTGSDQTGSSGSDGAHNNVQPTIILSYIIKY